MADNFTINYGTLLILILWISLILSFNVIYSLGYSDGLVYYYASDKFKNKLQIIDDTTLILLSFWNKKISEIYRKL